MSEPLKLLLREAAQRISYLTDTVQTLVETMDDPVDLDEDEMDSIIDDSEDLLERIRQVAS